MWMVHISTEVLTLTFRIHSQREQGEGEVIKMKSYVFLGRAKKSKNRLDLMNMIES